MFLILKTQFFHSNSSTIDHLQIIQQAFSVFVVQVFQAILVDFHLMKRIHFRRISQTETFQFQVFTLGRLDWKIHLVLLSWLFTYWGSPEEDVSHRDMFTKSLRIRYLEQNCIHSKPQLCRFLKQNTVFKKSLKGGNFSTFGI